MGMLYLLEAVRQLDSIKAVINIISDKCYEKRIGMGPITKMSRLAVLIIIQTEKDV